MKAAIFDVDGVIIDVRKTYHQAIKRTAELYLGKEVSLDFIRDIKFRRGINNDWDVTQEVLRERGLEVDYGELVREFTKIYDTLKDQEELLLDRDFFERLKAEGFLLGVVTGRPKEDLTYAFKRLGLEDMFDVCVDEDDVWNKELRKPHPFPLHMCMESLKADRAVYVGDTKADREMVLYYRKLYGGDVEFIHFTKVSETPLETPLKAEKENELESLIKKILTQEPFAEVV